MHENPAPPRCPRVSSGRRFRAGAHLLALLALLASGALAWLAVGPPLETMTAAAAAATAPAAAGPAAAGPAASGQGAPRKLVILGFDGADAKLAERWMSAGKLPNLAALRRQGAFAPLLSTIPSQTPGSWSTFATGLDPGRR